MGNSKSRIGVVDDDASVGKALRRLLKAAGFAAKEYHSAGDFLADQEICSFDCLILDITMPEMDGFSLRDRLWQEGLRTPVLFITALEGPEVVAQSKGVGRTAFLRKPFEDDVLIQTVRTLIA